LSSDIKRLHADSLNTRAMVTNDLSQVMMIENNAHISPWSRLSFEESLTKEYQCRVIESDDEVVAYSVLCPVVDEFHILNVVVAQQYQGSGLGHMLMQDIISLAQKLGLTKVFLEVRASNTIAQSLYEKWQFEQISIRKRYYSVPNSQNSNEREDAHIYLRQLRY